MEERVVMRAAGADSVLVLGGRWSAADGIPSLAPLEKALDSTSPPGVVALEADGLAGWDSSLVAFLLGAADLCRARKVAFDLHGLPGGLRHLVELAEAVPERDGAARHYSDRTLLAQLERLVESGQNETRAVIAFLGDITLGFWRLATGGRGSRWPISGCRSN